MNREIKKAYKIIDEVIQKVILAEEMALCGIITLLEKENIKFNSQVIKEFLF